MVSHSELILWHCNKFFAVYIESGGPPLSPRGRRRLLMAGIITDSSGCQGFFPVYSDYSMVWILLSIIDAPNCIINSVKDNIARFFISN
jgi:hypothetical protein